MSDSYLATRIRAGDSGALAALYDRYSRLVYGVALRVLRDEGAAEDVLQEVFLRLWQKPESFDSARGGLAPWLAVVARNRAIDRLRKQPREDELAETIESPDLNIEDVAVRSDLVARMKAMAQQLPREQWTALSMAYFDGLTHVEIAARTGEPLGTIKSRIRSAVAALGKALRP